MNMEPKKNKEHYPDKRRKTRPKNRLWKQKIKERIRVITVSVALLSGPFYVPIL